MHLLTFRMNPLGIVPGRLVLAESADGTFLGMAQLERMQIVKDKPTYEFRSLIVDPKYRWARYMKHCHNPKSIHQCSGWLCALCHRLHILSCVVQPQGCRIRTWRGAGKCCFLMEFLLCLCLPSPQLELVCAVCRHQGIGTALLMHVAGDCQDDVYLTTLNSTIGFYQRAGFNVVPPQSIPWWVAAYFVS